MDSRKSQTIPHLVINLVGVAWLFAAGLYQARAEADDSALGPVVAGFERLSRNSITDEGLAHAGLLLLAELNCTACHAAPSEWSEQLAAADAPNLAGIGSRLDAGSIRGFISDPQKFKPGSRMPGLFGPDDRTAGRASAIAAYLATLQEPLPDAPPGNAVRGEALYHRIGCVACHDPFAGARPANAPPDQPVARPVTPSVPIAFSEVYNLRALTAFLLDPLHFRPGGRMPSMRLGLPEAADLAEYLHGDRTPEPSEDRNQTKAPQAEIARGKKLFREQRCVACHSLAGEAIAPALMAISSLRTDRGCLGSTGASGVADYHFSPMQRHALQLAVKEIQTSGPTALTPGQKADWQLSRLNCYACHVRGGKGGPEPARLQFFEVNDPGAESLGELARRPPSLDRVGRKLTSLWLGKILWGDDGSVRPYLETRMPNFGRMQTEPLIGWWEEADRLRKPIQINTSGLLPHHRSELGRKLLGSTGLGCVSCHGLRDRKSLGPPVIRLTHTVERLRPAYFKELLLDPQATQPGTVMPPLFAGRKTADKDVESIWTYFKELDSQPLPEGLFSNEDYELKPAALGRPIILRSFIEGVGTHAIGVGFPQGLNAAFDARSCRWVIIWKGRFLDALSNWQDRNMKPIKPLGSAVKALSTGSGEREFRGYRLEKNGVPVMLYAENGEEVEDKLEPSADGMSLIHMEHRAAGDEKRAETISW